MAQNPDNIWFSRHWKSGNEKQLHLRERKMAMSPRIARGSLERVFRLWFLAGNPGRNELQKWSWE